MAVTRDDLPHDPAGKPERERGGWLAKFAPGVRKIVKRETPENLWVKCPDTGEMIYRQDLETALWVTPSGRHMRIRPELRFKYTFDGGKWETIEAPRVPDDPLNFVDDKPYKARLAQKRRETGEQDAMALGYGAIPPKTLNAGPAVYGPGSGRGSGTSGPQDSMSHC